MEKTNIKISTSKQKNKHIKHKGRREGTVRKEDRNRESRGAVEFTSKEQVGGQSGERPEYMNRQSRGKERKGHVVRRRVEGKTLIMGYGSRL